ncbi:MAG: hypothetical protein ABI977_17195 [Acidobacteriota bacterium]
MSAQISQQPVTKLKHIYDAAAEAYDEDLKSAYDSQGVFILDRLDEIGEGDTLGKFILCEIQSLIGHIEGQVYQDDLDVVVAAFDTAIDQLSTVRQKLAGIAIKLPRE